MGITPSGPRRPHPAPPPLSPSGSSAGGVFTGRKVIDRCPGCGSREARRFPDGLLRCAYCRTAVETPPYSNIVKEAVVDRSNYGANARVYAYDPPTPEELSSSVQLKEGLFL